MTDETRAGAADPAFDPAKLLPSDFYEYMLWMISVCANEAWIYMGLLENPKEKRITQDLAQAKMAIDVAVCLMQKLEEAGRGETLKEAKEIVTHLQVNFMERSKA